MSDKERELTDSQLKEMANSFTELCQKEASKLYEAHKEMVKIKKIDHFTVGGIKKALEGVPDSYVFCMAGNIAGFSIIVDNLTHIVFIDDNISLAEKKDRLSLTDEQIESLFEK